MNYKKIKQMVLFIICLSILVSCKGIVANLQIDYGHSNIFSKEDMDEAIMIIKEEFKTWKGCELHSIAYSSDDECNANNIAWMNDLGNTNNQFDQCIMFKSSFHSPKNGGGAWNADEEYEDWQWWLARNENGEWQLMTWGY